MRLSTLLRTEFRIFQCISYLDLQSYAKFDNVTSIMQYIFVFQTTPYYNIGENANRHFFVEKSIKGLSVLKNRLPLRLELQNSV